MKKLFLEAVHCPKGSYDTPLTLLRSLSFERWQPACLTKPKHRTASNYTGIETY